MDRLSSCYFCGTALDEPLQDYPLVAGDTGEHGAVVTLCPGCHHKLETVLDVVLGEDETPPALDDADRAALEGEEPAALTEPADGASAPDPVALGDGMEGDRQESDAEGGSETSDAGGGRDASAEAVADAGDEGGRDGGPPAVDEVDPETAAEAGAGESSNATAETGRDTGPGDSTGQGADSGEADGGESPTSEKEATDTAPETAGDDVRTAGDTVDGNRAKGGDGTDGDPAERGGGTDPDRAVTTTVSALEYNKVMRLLQNREFPVDRAEIETVAASAYELSESECAAVIDLAVDRGLVVEREGQLVRPDG